MTLLKGKAVQLQAWSGPEGSRKLRFPDFMTTAQDGGKVVSLTHQPPLSQEILLVLSSVRGWVDPRATVWSEGFCQRKIPMTSAGIEPATSRFLAQNLNPLRSNNHYSGRTAPLTSKRCILYIYSTNISTEHFKHVLCRWHTLIFFVVVLS